MCERREPTFALGLDGSAPLAFFVLFDKRILPQGVALLVEAKNRHPAAHLCGSLRGVFPLRLFRACDLDELGRAVRLVDAKAMGTLTLRGSVRLDVVHEEGLHGAKLTLLDLRSTGKASARRGRPCSSNASRPRERPGCRASSPRPRAPPHAAPPRAYSRAPPGRAGA